MLGLSVESGYATYLVAQENIHFKTSPIFAAPVAMASFNASFKIAASLRFVHLFIFDFTNYFHGV